MRLAFVSLLLTVNHLRNFRSRDARVTLPCVCFSLLTAGQLAYLFRNNGKEQKQHHDPIGSKKSTACYPIIANYYHIRGDMLAVRWLWYLTKFSKMGFGLADQDSFCKAKYVTAKCLTWPAGHCGISGS